MIEEFLTCYLEVFNEDGSQRACGRKKCIHLVKLAEKICPNANSGFFGSTEVLSLNQKALKELYDLLQEPDNEE